MAEYAPVYYEADRFPAVTSAAVTAGQCLIVSGSGTVAKSAGADASFLGIAAFDAASGDTVTVLSDGIHLLAASGSISAGNLVTTAASGAVAAHSGTNYSTIIGVALADAADSKVKVKLVRS